ncbi:MAG: tetratricopeptide repeat protein [Verrucomicrobiota bacterium]
MDKQPINRLPSAIARELFYALPLALMFLLALTPGISFTEDLGRHLLLGKIIVAAGHVPDTNLLTYTCPDFPFINHHWLSEVVFYFLHCASGLNGLILFKALLMCAALALAMRAVPLERASPLVGLAAVLAAVALGYRAHIRPELFTYFGVALYGWLIAREISALNHRKFNLAAGGVAPGPSSSRPAVIALFSGFNLRWAVLIAYGWFWANAHIYFVFGLGMIFIYWLACWRRNWLNAGNAVTPGQERCVATFLRAWPRAETIGLFALIGVSLINPNGWRGLFYPLWIFGNYGMAITENASPLNYWETVLNPMLMALPLLSLCALWVFWHNLTTDYTDFTDMVKPLTTDHRQLASAKSRHWWTKLGAIVGISVIRVIRGIIRIELSAGQLAGVLILLTALIAAWFMARSVPLLALTLLPALGLYIRAETSRSDTTKKSWIPDPTPPKQSLWLRRPGQVGNDKQTILSVIPAKAGIQSAYLRGPGIMLVIALNIWLMFAVINGSYCRIFPSPIGPTPFGLDDEFRYLALRRLQADGLPGKIFSDYNSGSLVEYNIYPERGYVDNRPEAFPAEFWQKEYLPALALGTEWEDVIARRGIQTVAVSIAGVKEHFIRALLANPRWQLVHLDFFLAVFTQNTPENQAFLRRHAFNQDRIAQLAVQTAERMRALSSTSIWRRQVLADQIVYEIYGLICLGRNDLAWPLVWEMHRRYPDYQLVHELMRVSAPPQAVPAVMEVMARRARWPLAAKQALDYGAALEAQGRADEARAIYRRGKFFFPLNSRLRSAEATFNPKTDTLIFSPFFEMTSDLIIG